MSRLANPKEERENTGGAAASSDDSDNGAPKERKGGLGRDKAARKFENATQEEREAANSDGKFGYYDMANKRYVPAFIDAMDGGGFDTRGDKFKGGPLSGLLNRLGVNPYGSQRERMFVAPNTSSAIQAAVQGGGAGGGVNRPMLRPDNFMTEAQKEQVVMNQPVGNGYPDMSMPAIEGYTTPKPAPTNQALTGTADMPPELLPINTIMSAYEDLYDRYPEGDVSTPDYVAQKKLLEYARFGEGRPLSTSELASLLPPQSPQPSALSGGTVQPMPASSQSMGLDVDPAMMGELNTSVNLLRANQPSKPNPVAFSANAPSAVVMTPPTPAPADRNPQLAAFNQAMSTVPAMLKGTQIEDMYRDHLLNGGGGTFAQFTGAQ